MQPWMVAAAISSVFLAIVGYAALSGVIDRQAFALFLIVFLWQVPHFLAIAWMYRDDYGRAGLRMLPVLDAEGTMTARQMVSYCLALVPVSLLPVALGMSGTIYFYGAIVLGLLFLYSSLRAAFSMSRQSARRRNSSTASTMPAKAASISARSTTARSGTRPRAR